MLPIQFSSGDIAKGTGGAAAVQTYPADGPGRAHCLWGIAWSVSATPTGCSIKIEDGSGNVVFGPHNVVAAGPDKIVFTNPMQGSFNTALIITLAAPGGSITSQVQGIGHFTTPILPLGPTSEYVGMGLLDFSQANNSGYLPLAGL